LKGKPGSHKDAGKMKRSAIVKRLWEYGTFFGWAMLLFSLLSCSNRAAQRMSAQLASDTAQDGNLSQDYQIGAEDVLEILIWKNEALSKVVTVRPDGKFSLPLIGDVQAAGLTAEQVKDAISEKFKEYYQDPPAVSLIVQQAKNQVIYILGGVKNPGSYVLKHGTTFLQAIAQAGGFTPFASTNNILVLRRGENGNKELALKIRYKDIISGNHGDSNILLRPMDTIIIPN